MHPNQIVNKLIKIFKPLAVAFILPATLAFVDAKPSNFVALSAETKTSLLSDTLNWASPLPFDHEVKVGKLKNGFTYYIRKNVEPKDRVTMYLGVKVGSILETEEELGLAHFLEHMNFNGLKHFPKNDLVNYLQSAGVRFGSDLNAYTGFEQTVYQLPIPSDDPELLKNGLQVLRDWAQDALLATDEIDKERGIVLEEMRGSRGAKQRMQDQYLPVLLNGSLYSNRLPIGTEEVITNFDPEVLRAFHKKWYRPDLQSLIVVGDIDPVQMEREIVRLFSDLSTPSNPVPRKEFKVDLINKNQYLVVTDPEMTSTVGQIIIKHPKQKVVTVGDYRVSLMKALFNQMINARLSEISQKPDAPFLQAGISIESLFGGLENLSMYYVAKPGEVENSTKVLARELERFEKYGFTESEFARALSLFSKGNETRYIERDKRKSGSYVEAYLGNFLEDNVALSNDDIYKITKQLLPTLTLKEIESIGREFYSDQNRDIIILAPEKDKDKLPTELAVNTWLSEVAKESLTAYEDMTSDLPMLANQPVGKGTVVSSKSIDAIGAKELVLSNGVKVILKPTTFKNDQILISAFSPGGTSLYGDNDYFSASRASSLVASSGVGQLNNVELTKYLTGKNVNVNPYISERSEGITGYSDKDGLPIAFEMIYGYFTEPRIEDDVFQSTISKTLSSMENREDDPGFVFSDAIRKTLYGNNIRRISSTAEQIKSIDQERALAIYKDRFQDASDFTFTIVGSFDEAEIMPYLESYLAKLPVTNRKEEAKDLGIVEPKEGVEKIVKKGKEEKAQVALVYFGDFDYSPEESLKFNALESVISIKLLERLREDESGVYGVGASSSASKFPTPRYSFQISFGTSVDKYKGLIASALDEVNKVKANGPTQVDLDKFLIEQKRQLELQLKEDNFWLSIIGNSYQLGEDPTNILKRMDELNKITVDSLKDLANKYLVDSRMFEFILLPEDK